MSDIHSLKGFQRACEKRKSLERKAKIFEENARIAKLSIDKQLVAQILQEMDRTHGDAIKELEEKIQEENRAHDDATKELREKIVDLEEQIRRSSDLVSITGETSPEPAQEMSETPQEPSTEGDESSRIGALQESVRELLQESEEGESEAPQEAPRKKKRGLF